MTVTKITSAPLIRAEQIMSQPLVFLNTSDTMRHAAAVFLDKKISGAPVLNHLKEPVGVITQTDIVRYEREHLSTELSRETRDAMRIKNTLEFISEGMGFHRESQEDYVAHWMTPKIYTIGCKASLADVVREMAQRRIHRILIHDEKRAELVGIITTFDLLQFLGRVLFVINYGSRSKKKPAFQDMES